MGRGPRGPARKAKRGNYQLLRSDAPDGEAAGDIQATGDKSRGASVLRLISLAKDEVWVISAATVALLVGSLASVTLPKLVGEMQDVVTDLAIHASATSPAAAYDTHKVLQRLNELLLWMLCAVLVGGVAGGVRSWLFESASERVMCRLRQRLFCHLMRQEVGFWDRVRVGELINRLGEDTRLMKSAGTSSISVALRSSTVACMGLVLMFLTSWRLALMTLGVLPVLMGSFHATATARGRYVARQLTASARAATTAEECFGCVRTVRAFAQEGEANQRYGECVRETQRWGVAAARVFGAFSAVAFCLATGAMAAILWYGARRVVEGDMTVGKLSAFILYVMYVGANVGELAGVVADLVEAVGASKRVFQLLDREPGMCWEGALRPQSKPEGGEMRLQGVWFAYPARPCSMVLKGVDLHVPPGHKLALVGSSGGGKSTIVSLLNRMYDPARGQVSLDGVPLPEIEHAYLHQQVSIVSQEPVLFCDTVLYNITFGLGGPSGVPLEAVEEAARRANAHDFIMSFPQGYQTMVGERGVRLSGGQKQRIAIARAFCMKPTVLLLDEATSALDAESEAQVQQALDRVAAGRTVVVVAHRLSTVVNSDTVVVIDAGQVAEQGTHQQLLNTGGAYSRLVNRQLLLGGRESSQASLATAAIGCHEGEYEASSSAPDGDDEFEEDDEDDKEEEVEEL